MISTIGLSFSRVFRLLGLAAIAAFLAHSVAQAADNGCSYDFAASADQHGHSHQSVNAAGDIGHGDAYGIRCCPAVSCGVAVPSTVEFPGAALAPARGLNRDTPLNGTLPGPIDRPPITE